MDLYPTIRTSQRSASRKPQTGFQHDGNPIGRLIAKVLREDRPVEGFEDYHALKTAIRKRLAILKVRYSQAQLDDAISLVDRNTPLVRRSLAATRRPSKAESVQADAPVISPAVAKQIVESLLQQTGRQLRTIPASPPGLTAEAINQFKREHVWHR